MRFFTNRIPTNSSGDFSKLIEKVAASRAQIKTAAVKEADTTEPANTNDVEVRKDVHSLEGLEHDQNGEPEGDDEKKVVDAPSLKASAEEPVKEAQIAAPARKPIQVRPQPKAAPAPVAARPQAKPAVPGTVPGAKPAPVAAKPAIPGAKPSVPGAAKPAVPGAKPSVPGIVAKPAVPGAQTVTAKPAVPGAAKPAVAPKSPALAEGEAKTKVADAPALGKGKGDGEELEGVTEGRFPEPDREEMYKQEPEEEGTAKTNKESNSRPEFVRIANLTPKAKSWLKKYWNMLYPTPYADAMTQSK
jgi:hypothetical protein